MYPTNQQTTLLALIASLATLGMAILTNPAICFGQESPIAPSPTSQSTDDPIELEPKLTAMGTFKDNKLNESSGLAFAKIARYPGAFWTHNDSGHKPSLFLIQPNGKTIGEIRLPRCQNRDWEAMCSFDWNGNRHLAIADVGDNSFNRESYQLICIQEPVRPDKKVKTDPTVFEFKFEGKSLNCEAVGFDPHTQSFWFVEKIYVDFKRKSSPGIFSLALKDLVDAHKPDQTADSTNKKTALPIAKKIGEFPVRNVTGMAFSPDNRRLVVRTYFTGHLFERSGDESWEEVVTNKKPMNLPLPLQSQGEAICFTDNPNELIVTSEQTSSTIWKIKLEPRKDADK